MTAVHVRTLLIFFVTMGYRMSVNCIAGYGRPLACLLASLDVGQWGCIVVVLLGYQTADRIDLKLRRK